MSLSLLLTDGTGLTSRQVATQAAAAGHEVDVLAPTWLGPASFTRHVRRVRRVPAFGRDPEAWLEACLAVLSAGSYDVLVPTQEQVAILSRHAERVPVAMAVPPFEALVQVQDKVAQAHTLARLGLPHAPTVVVSSAAEAAAALEPPVFVKVPIGTASAGVRRASTRSELRQAAEDFLAESGAVVVQAAADGQLLMAQSVFDHGRLIAWHANTREREGAGGGSSHKRSAPLPVVRDLLERLGTALDWHGALSFDAICANARNARKGSDPSLALIDVNPRLVEPGNAWRAGVDLVDALLDVSRGVAPDPLPAPACGVRTHQLLLAVLGAERRRDVAREVLGALAHRGSYAGSTEELTPLRGDPVAPLPVAVAAAAMLATPRAASWFTGGATSAYALTPAAWATIAG